MDKTDIKSLNITELKEYIKALKEPPFRAEQLFDWMHQKLASGFEEMTNLPKTLRQELEANCSYTVAECVETLSSKTDDTCKYLLRFSDGTVVECVRMKYHHGYSICISSQAGCRMGCRFCASTLGGLYRNLTPSEMLEEVYQIQRVTDEKISNVVVMGTGEPFDNYDNLVRFLRLLTGEKGQNLSQRSITISTCGLPEQIRSFAGEGIDVTLALSLHAPDDVLRRQLMPVANRYSLEEVLRACDFYYETTGRRISYEYSLMKGVNDAPCQAEALARLLKRKNCHVNLIPINPVEEREFHRPEGKNIQNFKNILEKNRINVTIRREMGADIEAACGQLRKRYMDKVNSEGGEL